MQLPQHIQQTVLETGRLMLKEVNPEIIAYIYTQWSDEDIMAYKGFPTPEDLALEKAKYFNGGFTTYRIKLKGFIFVLKETGEAIGGAHFHTWQPLHSRAEIGYHIMKEENRSKGYAREAIKAMLDFGFSQMGLNRVEALIGRNNEPSQRLVKGFGFVLEGVLREHYCKNGVMEDSLMFSLLKKDYQP